MSTRGPTPLIACALAFVLSACSEPCRTDNDCDTAGGIQRCVVETGSCEALAVSETPTCNIDENCVGGRSCVQGECVFRPACQRFTAPVRFSFAMHCDGVNGVNGLGSLTTAADCQSAFNIDGLDPVPLGVIPPVSNAAIEGCQGGVYEVSTGVLAALDCTVVGFGTCDVGLVLREDAQACLEGSLPCDAPTACSPLLTQGDVTVGRCQ